RCARARLPFAARHVVDHQERQRAERQGQPVPEGAQPGSEEGCWIDRGAEHRRKSRNEGHDEREKSTAAKGLRGSHGNAAFSSGESCATAACWLACSARI